MGRLRQGLNVRYPQGQTPSRDPFTIGLDEEVEEKVVLVDEYLLSEALEDRYCPAARCNHRLKIFVDDRQVRELKAAAAHVEQVRTVLEAGNSVAEETVL